MTKTVFINEDVKDILRDVIFYLNRKNIFKAKKSVERVIELIAPAVNYTPSDLSYDPPVDWRAPICDANCFKLGCNESDKIKKAKYYKDLR